MRGRDVSIIATAKQSLTVPPMVKRTGRLRSRKANQERAGRPRSQAAAIVGFALLCAAGAFSAQRFPPPEFETEYTIPTMTEPAARAQVLETLDVAVLVGALGAASWLALKRRSRKGIVAVMLFSLLYFGFWRKGCICAIGAIGNVTLGVFDASYVIPWMAAAFLFLPLAFTLFFGRSFCGGVCPLGAAQDAVLIRPVRVPVWLETALRLCAWLYLSLAVLYAALGSAFIICRYDPFVGFFRLNANAGMWAVGIAMVGLSLFVGRPYCRFLCPLGVLLRQAGRISRKRVTITPDECIQCRLCEDACPFGAIQKPTQWPGDEQVKGRRRLVVYLLLTPVLMAAGAGIGYAAHAKLAAIDPTVELADEVRRFEEGGRRHIGDEVQAFLSSGQQAESLYAAADEKMGQFAVGSTLVGGWMGLVSGGSLIMYSILRRRSGYEADRGGCVACGRCFESCPIHNKVKREKVKGKSEELAVGA